MIPASQKIQHPQFLDETGPTALVVAHPGHELRIHAWLERTRPHVFVLTDGSGHASEARLDATASVLERAGAQPGSIFGRFSDREAYRLILDQRLAALKELTRELADRFVELKIRTAVSDAVEGFNPVHDLCWILTESAVEIASRRLGRPIRHLDFPLESAPDANTEILGDEAVRFALDDAAWRRKLEEAWANEQLRFEVERAIETYGSQAFRVEVLRPASPAALEALLERRPYYEIYGEQRVQAGAYDRVLRFREHFLPLARGVKTWAETV